MSWNEVSNWYDSLVGDKGHYYHQNVIFPKLLKLLPINENSKLIDFACGQGVFARHLPNTKYLGIDLSPKLIQLAIEKNKNKKHSFLVKDLTKPLDIQFQINKSPVNATSTSEELLKNLITDKSADIVTIILALQDIQDIDAILKNASLLLAQNGTIAIVINHPCFRIPRQSSWFIEDFTQSRLISSYLSNMEIPIQIHPSKNYLSKTVFYYHRPFSEYVNILSKHGFLVEKTEEWISDKTSEGGAARKENKARKEFPLFLTIMAKKITSI